MALKIELKPGERFIVGNSVITNGQKRSRLFIEGDAPILRERDIIRADEAGTPCQKVYLVIQMMYLEGDPKQHHDTYFKLAGEAMEAAPSLAPFFDRVNNQILTGSFYKALKEAQAMIAYEGELLSNAKTNASL